MKQDPGCVLTGLNAFEPNGNANGLLSSGVIEHLALIVGNVNIMILVSIRFLLMATYGTYAEG